jgi:hypothetical protein
MKLDVARGVLLDRLAKLDALIEGHKATLSLLELERLVLQSRLGEEKRKLSGSTRERRA